MPVAEQRNWGWETLLRVHVLNSLLNQLNSLLDLALFQRETRFQKKVRGRASFGLWVV